MANRVDGWETAYAAEIARHEATPFTWGISDCWCMAMDVVKAVRGADPWAHARTYKTAIGSRRVLKRHGFTDVGAALAATFEEIPVAAAHRGDVGTVETSDGPAAVVFDGVLVVGKSPTGIIRLPRSAAKRAFRV